jgi:transcriptional regulator GlxA family with amidase domain
VTGAAISLFVKSGYVDRATDHWTRLASLSENCKLQSISDSMFVTDGRVTTCAGEFAIMDYLADWLSQSLSARHAKRAAERLIAYAPRLAFEKQPHSATLLIKGLPPPLRKAVEIMVNAIETPASIRSIADTSGLSARQLERLFKRYLDCSPSAFYKRIRLERSLSLIMQTELSLTEIAIACGFASQSNFSRNFSRLFGVKPTVVRAKSPSELNIEPNQVPYMAGV